VGRAVGETRRSVSMAASRRKPTRAPSEAGAAREEEQRRWRQRTTGSGAASGCRPGVGPAAKGLDLDAQISPGTSGVSATSAPETSIEQEDVVRALDHTKIADGPGGPAEMVPGQHHVRMNRTGERR
jgi:hypothetical protein